MYHVGVQSQAEDTHQHDTAMIEVHSKQNSTHVSIPVSCFEITTSNILHVRHNTSFFFSAVLQQTSNCKRAVQPAVNPVSL